MRNRLNIAIGFVLVALIGLTACEQYNWDPPIYEFDPTGPTVSFSDKVAPLFPKYNCTGCHGGVIPPDLRENFSFDALTSGNYIDLGDAEASEIVLRIENPEHGGTWSTDDLWLLLDWINQGTLDN